MRLSALPPAELAARLADGGVCLRTGPFTMRLTTSVRRLIEGVGLLYADFSLAEDGGFVDFHVSVARPASLRRWLRPQAVFRFDGQAPFRPLPLEQALPLLEWGLNWAVANHAHQYLIFHAAAVAKDGRAAILPGPPGAGKSTLTAGLVNRGWRLLSDELALLSLADGAVIPLARPVSLKNESIGVIRRFAPEASLSPVCRDTDKGAVALMKPPAESVARIGEPARPAWVVRPRFEAGAQARLAPRSRAGTCIELGDNAFNYSIHGARGFEALADLIDGCACYDLDYGDLGAAVEAFDALEPRR